MSPRPDLSDALDQEVVEHARQGREEAYRELVHRYQGPVYQLIYRIVHEHEVAEDLTQETVIKAFNALESQRPESKFSSWILTIANNAAVKHLKRKLRLKRKRLDTVSLEATPDTSRPRKVTATALRAAA